MEVVAELSLGLIMKGMGLVESEVLEVIQNSGSRKFNKKLNLANIKKFGQCINNDNLFACEPKRKLSRASRF